MDSIAVDDVTTVSVVRLHGHACWDCGAVEAPLVPVGEAVVTGFTETWPIVKCAPCVQGAQE